MDEVSESKGGLRNRGPAVVVCIVALLIVAWLVFPWPGKTKQLQPWAGFSTPAAASSLSATRMLPFATEPIKAGENQVYCPTMALAWAEMKSALPGSTLPDSNFAKQIETVNFTVGDIDASDIRIVSGRPSDESVNRALSELGIESNPIGPPGPDVEYQAICALKKDLPFLRRFEPFDNPLRFNTDSNTISVRSFGVTSEWKKWESALQQIEVLDYRSPENFIIRIRNQAKDSLILARMDQPKSIEVGLDQIKQKIATTDIEADGAAVVSGEQVVIPVLEFNMLEDYTARICQGQAGCSIETKQLIQFRFDEKGAQLVSVAAGGYLNGHYEHKVGERTFIFDGPFMLVLSESDLSAPYFAAWIANGDFMTPNQ